MKLTTSELKRIVREETNKVLYEAAKKGQNKDHLEGRSPSYDKIKTAFKEAIKQKNPNIASDALENEIYEPRREGTDYEYAARWAVNIIDVLNIKEIYPELAEHVEVWHDATY